MILKLQNLSVLSDNLLYLVILAAVFSLVFPGPGTGLQPLVTPVLALMVWCMSMTIRLDDLKASVRRPVLIAAALFLGFVPMPLVGWFLGKVFFGPGSGLATGQLLVASLPSDVAAPFMVYLASGDTALATAALTASVALTPLLLPLLLTSLGRVHLLIPMSYLMSELFIIIVVPVVLGVFLNNRYTGLRHYEPVYAAVSSLSYLLLLVIVVSANAPGIKNLQSRALLILLAALLLNAAGYLLGLASLLLTRDRRRVTALLFLTSTREFGIAIAAAAVMGLPGEMTIPAVFYAVVQMLTSPLMARLVRRLEPPVPPGRAETAEGTSHPDPPQAETT